MLSGGLPQMFVSDMDRAVTFYTEVLGMKLEYRFGNHWASLRIGDLALGLHRDGAIVEQPRRLAAAVKVGDLGAHLGTLRQRAPVNHGVASVLDQHLDHARRLGIAGDPDPLTA